MADSFRKIGIGDDMKDGLFYVVGTKFRGSVISNIILNGGWYTIYIKKDDVEQEWKSVKETVVTFKEYALNE